MIQRKQSLFLLLAFVAILLCMFFPLATIQGGDFTGESLVFCLAVNDAVGGLSFATWPLFALLAASGIIALATIFLYRNRVLQMRLCLWGVVLQVLWYVYFALIAADVISLPVERSHFAVNFPACLPLVSIILFLMARKGVSDDEKLVRAADRIR